MTMETVSGEFNVPVEAFMKKFNLSEDTNPEEMLKDIAKANNLEVEDFRTFIVEYIQQGEIPPGQSTAPEPSSAVQPEQSPALEERSSEPSSPVQSESQPVVEERTEKQASIEIRGKTTIGELLGYGMTKEDFKEITGVEMPDDAAMILKDFADANGLDMETLKEQIIEALQQ
jgi:hypothetical protein